MTDIVLPLIFLALKLSFLSANVSTNMKATLHKFNLDTSESFANCLVAQRAVNPLTLIAVIPTYCVTVPRCGI